MKQIIKQISVIVILLFMNTHLANATSNKDQANILWFSTSTSGFVNRSSMEMATQHVSRGIRFAQKALKKELSLSDQLIANHNLCIGYLLSDQSEIATPYCARTFKLAQGPISLSRTRGAYRLSESDATNESQSDLSLVQVVVNNIQQPVSQIQLSLLRK